VRLLCSVFDLAGGGDLASVARASWRHGAPADVPGRVIADVAQARLHLIYTWLTP
jgi:hypothetical protein